MRILGFEKLSLVDFNDKIGCTHNYDLVCSNPLDFEEISFTSILEYLRFRKGKIEAVCVTGGEPTLNYDLKEKLAEIKKIGYYIKLDTNGSNYFLVRELLEEGLVDYVAMDVKNSLQMYKETIGKDINVSECKKTIDFLINSSYDYEFRTTLVDEFHSYESIREMGELIKGAKRLYLQKFIQSENCLQPNLSEVSLDKANEYKKILSEYVKDVYLRGY
ncbi:MAG: anaerobic ribonucleoside-triphosphate reductase activating protein [Coprobacillus sp. 28_7]|nr:MAG: anaerobic ribonucleoside-triphosphate reductase activating protein [Coprobacillus sp. 28_7]